LSAAWEKESAFFAAFSASKYGCSFFRFASRRAALAARASSSFARSALTAGTESYANAMRCGPTADRIAAAVIPRSRRLRHGLDGETDSNATESNLRDDIGSAMSVPPVFFGKETIMENLEFFYCSPLIVTGRGVVAHPIQ